MASSKSSTEHQIPEANQDLISSLPTVLTDKILKLLPLRMAAQTSVLSMKWRQSWLSHRYLVFDADFWEGQRTNGKFSWQKISNIINNILFHHNGPIHKFHLYIPDDVDQVIGLNVSQWLSFLSRNGIKKIVLVNWYDYIPMPSHIYTCKDLVELRINKYALMPPPSSFEGFASLRSLELLFTEYNHDTFRRLLASCPRLTMLKLIEHRKSMHNLVINVPSLEHLSVDGAFETLAIENAHHLKSISLTLYQSKLKVSDTKLIDMANLLIANSSKLQNLHFGGGLCKLLAAGGITKRFCLAFNHLHTLSLTNLDLGDFRAISFTVGMIKSCPFIKDLKISVSSSSSVVKHQFDYNDNIKLEHLHKVEIKSMTGSTAELKFIEYVLAISVVLEKLFFMCSNLDPISELKVSRELLQFPRASTKAKLICLEQ